MDEAIELLEDDLKIDQENGGVGSIDQENDHGVGKDLIKGSSYFLEELRDIYDDLAPEANIYFNSIKSNEEKTNYLKSILATKKKQRSKGALVVNFLTAVIVPLGLIIT
ncbi:unnamed protein product [Rhizophagus irregularis]|nr:unnamed protein product [Rhizophagus irregularis]CAB4427783.1 unnamed protein product [Rhizophagus irregularis]